MTSTPLRPASGQSMIRTAWALVIANIVIVLTGGAVRLTQSGLGCDNWPRCTEDSWTTTPEMGIHGMVEFGNRLLTFVLVAITIWAFLTALKVVFPEPQPLKALTPKLFTGLGSSESTYSDLFNLALLLLWGIPVQAVVGGISVWMKLNPWMVTAHYMLSALMIGLTAIYLNRVYRYFGPSAQAEELEAQELPAASGLMKALGYLGASLVFLLLLAGTVVTGTGPHAGDATAARHLFDPVIVARNHGLLVWIYCASLLVFYLLARKHQWAPALGLSSLLVLVTLLIQAAIGYTQYFNGLPVLLVEAHLLGSALFTLAASSLAERQLTLSSAKQRDLARQRLVG